MAEMKFEVGSVVVLKSGGPDMTVIGYIEKENLLMCKWFDNNEVRQDYFPPEALIESEDVPF